VKSSALAIAKYLWSLKNYGLLPTKIMRSTDCVLWRVD
jgi:hypothetical protein